MHFSLPIKHTYLHSREDILLEIYIFWGPCAFQLGLESRVFVLQMKILGLLVNARHVNKQDVSLLPNLSLVLVKSQNLFSGPFFSGPVFSGPVFSGPVFLDPFLSDPVFSTWYF